MDRLDASVIIPTYNRAESLRSTLDSLSRQSCPPDHFEVVVVDDGSIDDTRAINALPLPFRLNYIFQENKGSAHARNAGALASRAELLVFMDDDMTAELDYISGLVSAHRNFGQVLGMGYELPWLPTRPGPFALRRAESQRMVAERVSQEGDFVRFDMCVSNNLSVMRDDFIRIGQWQDVAGDGPTWWGDVDFGYRAHLLGYRVYRSGVAACAHRDETMVCLESAAIRCEKAAFMASRLFAKWPELEDLLPMFEDKRSICVGRDPARLIVRKVARQASSSKWSLSLLEGVTRHVERIAPRWGMLDNLYRWIMGAHIYRGYRKSPQSRRSAGLG